MLYAVSCEKKNSWVSTNMFRMVGGVLVERTVKEVVPALVNNRDKMEKLIETLNSQGLN